MVTIANAPTDCSVSLVICTRDRAEALRQTLMALAEVDIPPDLPTELLVVDNGSTDHTRMVVEECALPQMDVRYLFQPEPGLSRSRNAALAEARGQFFLFTDDDIRPPADWVTGMCGPLIRGEADAVAGGVRFAPHLNRFWMEEAHRGRLADSSKLNPDAPDRMIGASMAFSRNVLQNVAGFDTELGAGALGMGEETLFSLQLREAGRRIVGALDVKVEHHFEESRLLRASFFSSAEKFGRTAAYYRYHWEHASVRFPALRLAKHQIELVLWRLTHWPEWHTAEGMPVRELEMLEDIAFYRQYLVERRRPRNYNRGGLVKKSPEGTS